MLHWSEQNVSYNIIKDNIKFLKGRFNLNKNILRNENLCYDM